MGMPEGHPREEHSQYWATRASQHRCCNRKKTHKRYQTAALRCLLSNLPETTYSVVHRRFLHFPEAPTCPPLKYPTRIQVVAEIPSWDCVAFRRMGTWDYSIATRSRFAMAE